MRRRKKRCDGKGALDLIDEAVHLLRLAPAGVLAAYYLGALPFTLGLLYFWADMSRGAFAWKHCAQASLGVALLYVWMKCWQAVFARQLYARLSGQPQGHWTLSRVLQMAATQALIQSTSFFVLPLAALVALPFGWAYAFYHNVSLFGDSDPGQAARQSWRQAALWGGQNHVVISILWLFGFYVFANVMFGVVILPSLLKMFLGIEIAFTMSPWALFNTTLLTSVCCLTYLCINPLIKTVYVLRCFYGESLQSAADLKAELKSLLPAAALIIMLFVVPVASATNPEPPAANRDLPAQLDRSINEVINQPEFTWRLPREKEPVNEEQKGFLARFFDSIIETVQGWFRVIRRFLRKLGDWLDEWLRQHWKPDRNQERTDRDWLRTLHVLLFVLVAVVVVAVVFLLWRVWKQRRRRVEAVAKPVLPAVDLTDENVVADQLPADGWLAQARDLMARGELRLALRALYLASLAHLAQNELIVIAKFKSNRDYEHELHRRAHLQRQLLAAFDENVVMFESAWYGMHDVTQPILDQFTTNLDAIRERDES
jgi:hypothetical protein